MNECTSHLHVRAVFSSIAAVLLMQVPGVSAQRINLNFTSGSDYAGSSETSPATPGGSAGIWNNITLSEANADVAVTYADGSPGPVLQMDTGRSGNWSSSITTETANYTGSGAVYDVANLYETGLRNGDNSTLGYRLRGLEPGTYAVHMIPIYRDSNPEGEDYRAGIHLYIGTGNNTDPRDDGDYTLVTTDAGPEQSIDSSLTTWVAATNDATPYNYVTAVVTIDSTNRWLTFLLEDGSQPDRPGPSVIQIEPTVVIPPIGPTIAETLVQGDNIILRGTNGSPNVGYHILASTNLTNSAATWPSIGTNWFDLDGNFDTTNPVETSASRQYFRLLVDYTLPPRPVAPMITVDPLSLTVLAGVTTNLLVEATGTDPLIYSWFFNSTIPIGGNTNVLLLTNVQADDAGDYYVIVSNGVGVVTSAVATLTVDPAPPFIISGPENASVVVSNATSFTVEAGGTAPLSYQWFFDGTTPIGGDTNTLELLNVQTNNAGDYSVVVSNSVGSVTSAVATLTVLSAPSGGGLIYVAPDGVATNPGTLTEPTTLDNALTLVVPGGTIYMRGGTYSYSTQITINHGNDGFGDVLPKRLFAFPGEQPVIDFSSQPYGKTSQVSNPRGIQINADYWHLRGLEVMGSADNGIFVAGNSNIVELCVTHHNHDTGLQISRYSSTAPDEEWPSYNLILNCDSYDNYDSYPNQGENADGFACKLTSGPGNVFSGCISHNNIDDGWDMFTKTDTGPIGPVVIDQCIAYENGVLTDGTSNNSGDRNGFKLGGTGIAVDHTVTRCIAFDNGKNGFTFNSNPGAILMVNNFAFNNAQGNFKFDDPAPIFINNVSIDGGDKDRYGGNSGISTGPNNIFWFNGAPLNDLGLTASTASFETLTVPAGGFARYPDGTPNLGGFAKLVAGNQLIDAGDVPVQPLPFDPATYYIGDPDLGAVESGP